jgi:hypothetical protein
MAVDSVSSRHQEQPQKLLLHGRHQTGRLPISQLAPRSHGTVSDPSHLFAIYA